MNAFFKAQFNYCPATWMLHSRILNNNITWQHERCLKIKYNDKLSNFDELLHKDNSVSIHHNNTHALAIEMYKVVDGMSPEIMNEVFKQRNNPHYNLRHTLQFCVNSIHTVYNGTELSQHCIWWGQKFGSKCLLKFEIRSPLKFLKVTSATKVFLAIKLPIVCN